MHNQQNHCLAHSQIINSNAATHHSIITPDYDSSNHSPRHYYQNDHCYEVHKDLPNDSLNYCLPSQEEEGKMEFEAVDDYFIIDLCIFSFFISFYWGLIFTIRNQQICFSMELDDCVLADFRNT